MYKNVLKRDIDFGILVIALLVGSPHLFIVFIILLCQNKGKVFFFQERLEFNRQPFKIIKFKTMKDEKDANGALLPDSQQITKNGGVLRKLSIDELPKLIKVIKGFMSFVGPRPLLFKYFPLYTREKLRKYEFNPGITGWARVNGRNSISWTPKFEYDSYICAI